MLSQPQLLQLVAGAVRIVFRRYLLPFLIPHIVMDLKIDTDLLSLLGACGRKVPESCSMEKSSEEYKDLLYNSVLLEPGKGE